MRHHRAGRDDALRCAEVLAQAPRPLDLVHQLGAGRRAALDVEPEHAAVQAVAVVLVRQCLLGEGGQARVVHLGDLGVALQEGGDGHGIGALLLHAQAHGLGGLQDDEGRERVHDVAVHILNPLDLGRELRGPRDDRAAGHHVVALIILRQALDDHVGAVLNRPANHGRGEGGIDDVVGTVLLGELGDRLDVAQGQQGVGRHLAEDQLGVRLHGLLDGLHITEVAEGELHA
mmetsp:Transcript_57181/g.149770  ORF Transcript_57181/g.149770 Transcript_57181/m.149770 type:complete len:231 (+) Transcript_57181:160-852(+)